MQLAAAHRANLREQLFYGARGGAVETARKDLADQAFFAPMEQLVSAGINLQDAQTHGVENQHALSQHIEEAAVAGLYLPQAPVILLQRLLRVHQLLAQVRRGSQVDTDRQHRAIAERVETVLHGKLAAAFTEAVDEVHGHRRGAPHHRLAHALPVLGARAGQGVFEGSPFPGRDRPLRQFAGEAFGIPDRIVGVQGQREVGKPLQKRGEHRFRLLGEQESCPVRRVVVGRAYRSPPQCPPRPGIPCV